MRVVDPATWPAFDVGALPVADRHAFAARRQAIELYAAGQTLEQIELRTGINRRQLYRQLDRCMAPHEDGRPFGWRAITPYARIRRYQRRARVAPSRDGTGRGAAGAFGLLLEAYPALATWIVDRVHAKRLSVVQRSTDDGLHIRVQGLKNVHVD
ncbi:integrase, partial [Variovorax sp. J22R133]|nr:integrase [Variovorax sp. J22R133]